MLCMLMCMEWVVLWVTANVVATEHGRYSLSRMEKL